MTKIYLAGPMQEGHGEHYHNDAPAEWRLEIMMRARIPRNWLYPESVETEFENHDLSSINIPSDDIELIKNCDYILAFIDSPDRIGTFCELAAAHALNKTSFVAILNPSIDDPENYRVIMPWFLQGLVNDSREFLSQAECINWLIRCVGGEGTNYHEYIRSPEWRARAEAAKERAGQRCQVCYKHRDETTLDAHHRTYERLGKELPEDITVLCRDCHSLYEEKRKIKA